ncbi:hypothetical protein [Cellvibrio sp. UBA7671]|uniref:hypothetical protein n=1 Tax=Cellvibrio sp. UBA7671 TaxID=1946312 RepID=UPI002F35AB46
MQRIILFFYLLTFTSLMLASESLSINAIATKSELSGNYCVTLLNMALTASKQDNEIIDVKFTEFNYSQARLLRELNFVSNSVAWSMSDDNRNSLLTPIRIPLFKGLLGMRVLLIRKEDQLIFDKIKTLDDLGDFVAGQGAHWPDTKILRDNGLRVVTAMESKSLLKMLKGKRFDYFPRGVVEAWYEASLKKDPSLAVEKNILLAYSSDLYFYVSADNQELAKRIEKGLKILIDNGEFDRYFYNHPRVKESLSQLESNRRRIFYLDVDVAESIPHLNSSYWYRPYTGISN